MDLTLVIMAAGIGSRYGGVKQLDEIGPSGETLMDYSIHDAMKAGFNRVVFIIRRDLKEAFDEHYHDRFKNLSIDYAFQDEFKKYEDGLNISRTKPWGTGHAMLSAAEHIHTPFAILNADDFYGASAFKTLAAALKDNSGINRYFLVGYHLVNTLSDFGSVSRGLCHLNENHDLTDITELTKIKKKGSEIIYVLDEEERPLKPNDLVSMNFWGFMPGIFEELDSRFKKFIEANHANPKAEFYIPSFVDTLIKDQNATVHVLPADEIWMGITYREDRPFVSGKLQEMVDNGLYPDKLG